jgi:uncharacterized protein (DUF1015 family)
MADPIVHPIDHAWISVGGTGAQNYDEFADEAEIEAIVTAQPASILTVDMPHCTPQARAAGQDLAGSLQAAADQLQRLKDEGRFRPESDVVAAYRIAGTLGTAYGIFALVDTDQISSSADEPGRVIRNEDVFAEKVAERTALTARLHHLLSPVLLLQATHGPDLEQRLAAVIDTFGQPAVADTDQLEQVHELWLIPPGAEREALLTLASEGELVVADGNHRSLSAQQAGLTRFLAVVTTPGSVHIRPYNRLLRDLNRSTEDLLAELTAAGCTVSPWRGDVAVPAMPGTVALYAGAGQAYAVTLPQSGGDVVERMDHAVVERLLFNRVLGMDAGDKRISYVGGDYAPDWLVSEVDNGRQDLAVLISPVTVEDFLEVNLQRRQMPRKSTWFSPKARTGLLLVELD